MESGVCEEQLNQVETLLQTVSYKPLLKDQIGSILPEIIIHCCYFYVCVLQDTRMLSSGKPAQHTAEMEADLEKAEGMIRLLFNDVQLLKDGRHLQAEQMYRRCKRNKLFDFFLRGLLEL